MSQSLSIAAALGAAGSAAVAAALQARSARHQQQPQGAVQGAVQGLTGFARQQLARKVWWAALVVQALGFALHAVALSAGALTLVQPLMASAIVLALPLNHILNGSAVTQRELVWAGLLAVGLSGFLVTSAASQPLAGSTSPGTTAAAGAVVLIAGCVALAGRSGSRGAAALLGTGAATAFAAEAALLQDVAGMALTNPSRLLTNPALYGLMVAGFLGVALTQLAYRAGPMSAALPAIVTVNPLLSIGYGIVVLRETFRHTPTAVVTEILCFGLLCVGAVALTRHAQPDGSPLPLSTG